MKRRWSILLLAVAGATLVLLATRSREPRVDGRSLSQWLDVWAASSGGEPNQLVEQAIRQMGTDAVPYLVEMIRAKDSWLKTKMIDLEARQSFFNLDIRTAYEVQMGGLAGLEMLGPAAMPAIPVLTNLLDDPRCEFSIPPVFAALGDAGLPYLLQALNHTNPKVRANAAWSLGSIQTTNEGVVLAALLKGFDSSDSPVRMGCASALGRRQALATQAIPALVRGLSDADHGVQRVCAYGLGNFGTNAMSAIPALAQCLANPGLFQASAQSLRQIDVTAALSAHVGILKATNSRLRVHSIYEVATFGTNALSAVPALLKALGDPDEWVKEGASRALFQIDPEAAAKAGISALPPRRGRRSATAQ